MKIADEVFLATALLHRENPQHTCFSASEIAQRVRSEFGDTRQSVVAHVSGHCVANAEPDGGRYRILYRTSEGNRRLLLPGDDVHPSRRGKIFPDPTDVPGEYLDLIDWAKQRYEAVIDSRESPLLALVRACRSANILRSSDEIDEQVRQLREGVGLSRIFFDTNLFIYLVEGSDTKSVQVGQLLEHMARRRDQLFTSTFTLAELLVRPLRTEDRPLVHQYESLLSAPRVSLIDLDRPAARLYAEIRGDKSIKAPDAIQLACAARGRCDLFITNDDHLSRRIVPGIQFITSLDKAWL